MTALQPTPTAPATRRNSSRRLIALTAAITVAICAMATAGVSRALGTNKTYFACANSQGTLSLLSRGKCPGRGTAKVALGQRGPMGKPGAVGKTGATGKKGARGPGAVSADVVTQDVNGSAYKFADLDDGSNLSVVARCQPGRQATAGVVDFSNAGPPITVHGFTLSDGGDGFARFSDRGKEQIPAHDYAEYGQVTTDTNPGIYLYADSGEDQATWFVNRTVKTAGLSRTYVYQVELYVEAYSYDTCRAEAIVIPTA